MRHPLFGYGRRRQPRRRRARGRRWLPSFEMPEKRLLLTTFYVLNNNDDGPGSLRFAIELTNIDPLANGADIIVPGGSIGTISPLSALPPVTRNQVTLFDFTIDGTQADSGADGLDLDGNYDSASLLNISGFSGSGITINGSHETVTDNQIVDNPNNVANANGIDVFGGNNTISGNLVSGNGTSGINLDGASGNLITGNLLGTDSLGTSAQGNGFFGIAIQQGAADNTIGGVGTSARNVISGNHQLGLAIIGAGSDNEVVEGNYIGVDITGSQPLGNAFTGIYVGDFGVPGQGVSNVTIGGTAPGAGNVISANENNGIWLSDAGTTGVVVQGNFVGTDATGTVGLGNAQTGVYVQGAEGNTIGGSEPGAGNVVSGNNYDGIDIAGAASTVVQGNTVGLNQSGTAEVGNGFWGIGDENSPGTTIGGTASGAGNVVSGNDEGGITIAGAGSSGAIVQGNIVGLGSDGSTPLGNAYSGVLIGTFSGNYSAPSGVTIGGTTAQARNVISANGNFGVWLGDPGTTDNVVQGNYIGTDATGTVARGNTEYGVYIDNGSSGNTIGGSVPGARNVLSGDLAGVVITDSGTTGNVVAGNNIGTNAPGTAALGNTYEGVFIGNGSTGNTIGGTLLGARNVISGNNLDGVRLYGQGTSSNVVEGDYIGTDGSGLHGLGNLNEGVSIFGGATDNTIGGTSVAAANVISGNGPGTQHPGVYISGQGTSGNVVKGNLIGTDATGTRPLGNGGSGALIDLGATDNSIGGTQAGSGNVLSGNGLYGARVRASGSSGNVIQGNFIGADRTGTLALGNAQGGTLFDLGASSNTLGGTTPGAGNVIAFNSGNGVTVGDNATDTTTGISILGNSIHDNTALGIDLADDGVTLNDSSGHTGPNLFRDFPVLTSAITAGGTTVIQGTLSGTPGATYRVELFGNPAADPSSYGQGKVFLTSVNVPIGPSGTASFSVPTSNALVGEAITATATDSDGNTSEFSKDITDVGAPPIDVTGQIKFASSGLVYNRSTGLFTGTITLTNIGASALYGPLEIVLAGLTPGVTLTNAAGTTSGGDPYLIAYLQSLGPGQSVTLTVSFRKTSLGQGVTYTPRIYTGA